MACKRGGTAVQEPVALRLMGKPPPGLGSGIDGRSSGGTSRQGEWMARRFPVHQRRRRPRLAAEGASQDRARPWRTSVTRSRMARPDRPRHSAVPDAVPEPARRRRSMAARARADRARIEKQPRGWRGRRSEKSEKQPHARRAWRVDRRNPRNDPMQSGCRPAASGPHKIRKTTHAGRPRADRTKPRNNPMQSGCDRVARESEE